jgi:beta-lactamase class D
MCRYSLFRFAPSKAIKLTKGKESMKSVTTRTLTLAATLIACISTSCVHAFNQVDKTRDLSPIFERASVNGTFTMLDAQSGNFVRHNPKRAARRYLPASTFKIPNSLIALESKVASGPDFSIKWDPARNPQQSWWPPVWAKDHTMRTALPNSVVWYYQQIARRVGQGRMQSYVNQFEYGNRDISGGIDQFWLTGGLRISADEQVDFLRRFYNRQLGVSNTTTQIVKDLLVLEQTSQYRLSGKSGWAGLGDPSAAQLGWLVGYLEREGQVYFFAMNIDIQKNGDAAARLMITKEVFHQLGLL